MFFSILVLIITILFSIGLLLYRLRDFKYLMHLFLGAIATSGLILMVLERIYGQIPIVISELTISIVFLSLGIFISTSVKMTVKSGLINTTLPLISGFIALSFVISRVLANVYGIPLFSGAGRVASSEDNAKWLNFSSNLVQQHLINFKDGTSGGLAVLLIICSAFVTAFSYATLGGVSQTGVAIHTVLLAHVVLISIIPLLFAQINWNNQMESLKFSNINHRARLLLHSFGIYSAIAFVVLAIAATSTFGHLSFEMVIVQILFWGIAVVYSWKEQRFWLLITVVGSTVALVWLPLPAFAGMVAGAGMLVGLFHWLKQKKVMNVVVFIALIINFACTVWLALPEIQYLSATTQTTTSIALVVAEGGTMSPKKFEFAILVIAVVGAILFLWFTRKSTKLTEYLKFYPIIFLLGYAVLISAYDYVVAKNGWPHYGTRKLAYASVVLSSALLMPLAFWGYSLIPKWNKVVGGITSIVLAISLALSATVGQIGNKVFGPEAWSVSDLRYFGDTRLPKTWVDVINSETSSIGAENRYVACVQEEDGKIILGYTDHYYCTRFLISLSGSENFASSLIFPLISKPNSETLKALTNLSPYLSGKRVMVINDRGEIAHSISLDEYIELFSSQI